jgi:hypothetical protein
VHRVPTPEEFNQSVEQMLTDLGETQSSPPSNGNGAPN